MLSNRCLKVLSESLLRHPLALKVCGKTQIRNNYLPNVISNKRMPSLTDSLPTIVIPEHTSFYILTSTFLVGLVRYVLVKAFCACCSDNSK